MDNYEMIIFSQLEGVEIELHATPAGYLLKWGDYVANEWVEGFSTLAETFAKLEQIAKDANL